MTKRLSPIKQNSWKLLLALFWACLWLSAGARAEASQETYPPFEDVPVIILVTTTVSAFLTSLYTRKIKSSDTANIE